MKEIRPFLAGISLAFILAGWLLFQACLAWEVKPVGYGIIALAFGVFAGLGVLGGPLLLFWGGYMIWKRGRLPGRVHALIFLPPLAAFLMVQLVLVINAAQTPHTVTLDPAVSQAQTDASPSKPGSDVVSGHCITSICDILSFISEHIAVGGIVSVSCKEN